MKLNALDFVIIGLSFVALFAVAIWTTWKRRKTEDTAEYFLSGRGMMWWAIGSSLFASNIGTEHFVGQAGSAAAAGLAVAWYEWGAIWLLLLLGWVFGPEYLARKLTTIPEWFEYRFNKWCRLVLAVVCMGAYIISKIAATLYAAGVMFEVVFNWNSWYSIPVILVITGAYTMGGGLSAVMYTDTIQMFIFFFGGLAGSITAFSIVGGYGGMTGALEDYGLNDFMIILRPVDDKQYAWTGLLIGATINSVWYWCIDQEMVQRVLSSRSVSHAKWGILMAGCLKLFSPFVIVFPGIIARVLYEKCIHGDGFPEWCGTDLGSDQGANNAYPYLINLSFPMGVRGVMVASMLAAMTSSLSSVFNSACTVFTVDIYLRFIHPEASDKRVILVGRLSTAVVTGLAIAWLPVIQGQKGQLYLITQAAMTHLSPSLCVVFVLGFFFKQINALGALIGLSVGTVMGVTQLILSLVWHQHCEDTSHGTKIGTPWWQCLHFNHFAIFLSFVVTVVTVGVSAATGGFSAAADEKKREARQKEIDQCEELSSPSEAQKEEILSPTKGEALSTPLLDTEGDPEDANEQKLTGEYDNTVELAGTQPPTREANTQSPLLATIDQKCFSNVWVQHAGAATLFFLVGIILIVWK